MRKGIGIALVCGLALLSISTVPALGRGVRGGVVMGPNGPLYDTRTPEWRMSGGNIMVYQELMQQKMMLQQQKYMMQQMQQMQKLQKAQKGQGKTNTGVMGQPGAGQYNPYAEPVNHYHRKKYKHGVVDPAAKAKAETGAGAGAESTETHAPNKTR